MSWKRSLHKIFRVRLPAVNWSRYLGSIVKATHFARFAFLLATNTRHFRCDRNPSRFCHYPGFNEEGSVAQLQAQLESALKEISYEIVFVDDGSLDRTVENIRRGSGVR